MEQRGDVPENDRRQWLVIFNCQAQGLANCLTLLNNEITVDHYDPATFTANRAEVLQLAKNCDRVIVAPELEVILDFDLGPGENVWRIPPLYFTGYHPDSCNLADTGPLSTGPLGHYHSALAYAAYRSGFTESQAVQLFGSEAYESLGYFDHWTAAAEQLLFTYDRFGMNLSEIFVKWSRSGPFMHTINHPKIHCLRDLAKALLVRAGCKVFDTDIVPYDNLINGPIYPVYTELGTRLGVRGSYGFKSGDTFRLKTLEQFVAACFHVYRGAPETRASMEIFLPRLDQAVSFVKGRK
jgi:hypothetical protein